MFRDLRLYYKSLDEYFSHIQCDTCWYRVKYSKTPDGKVVEFSKEYEIDSSYLKPYINVTHKIHEIDSMSEKAYYPLDVVNYLAYPAKIIIDKYIDMDKWFSQFCEIAAPIS